ncbi:secreted glycosyl hydrolase [Grosmannia clavigera kw1407]|uniref:Secreted glycosyl hydrolase n=1 Tax=Grosmannia clavigera (strain kw1407 / UAMH 11150) TaxID=655863 RepID=F0XJB1_GROCL|nr:secreted glycosyl hydrolase [Grosmannia clavigera kw1407]EFX02104.1 secreted glycosyl hydrolase [Grosmannia clavigera kw1407]
MSPPTPFRVLVFSKTAGGRHECIPAGIAMFQRLAETSQAAVGAGTGVPFEVDASEDAETAFTTASLDRYRVVVLLQTTGDYLDATQLAALQAYVNAGRGGIVAIHAAAVGMKSRLVDTDGWYGRLLGAVFVGHPAPQLGRVVIKDRSHPTVAALLPQLSATEASVPEPSFSAFDEWYNFELDSCAVVAASTMAFPKAPRPAAVDVPNILLSIDETTYEGGKVGENHPIAWWQTFGNTGTRVFYTAMGHFAHSYEDDVFVQHLHDALLWTAKIL